MGKYDRLSQWIIDYFPDPSYSTQEVIDYCETKIPAWKHIPHREQKSIVDDWENFIAPQIEEEIRTKRPSLWKRIRRFLGRLF